MKVHVTYGGKTSQAKISDQLVGLGINSRILVSHHPGLVQVRSNLGFPEEYLLIRGGSGVDGTPMRADLKSPRPMRVRWIDRGGVHRLRRFRPNQIYPQSIAVVDCIPVE